MRNSILELINAIKNSDINKEEKDYFFEFLTERLEKFPNYVNSVFMMNLRMPMLRARFNNPAELEYQIKLLDEKRKIAHDSVIHACKQINRLGVAFECKEKFYPENLENVEITLDLRHNIAKFVGDFVNETFNEEIIDKNYDCIKSISNDSILKMEEELNDEYER